jgi:exopolysaccharide biosynthesis polyprenyl glycosylphosphotransferase
MNFQNKREAFLLFLGDIILFYVALWTMLFVRYDGWPSGEIFSLHAIPFSILFLVWIAVFYIAGLYEKHTLILKSRIGSTVLNAQIVNSAIAFLFFYLIPYFGITPKTNLFIYLVISLALTIGWRSFIFPTFEVKKRQNAFLVGTGSEMRELEQEVNNNYRYNLYFLSSVDLDEAGSFDFQEEIVKRIYSEGVGVVVADFKNEKVEPFLPSLYNLIFSKVKFIDMHKVYEDIFDRIPLSLVKYSWFLENVSTSAEKGYDFLKNIVDVVLSFVLGLPSLIVYPFVCIAIKLEDGGKVFFTQERVGKNNRIIKVIKFRSMEVHDSPDGIAKEPNPTRVGKFIRKTRIDELPQLWNVFVGDLSMIGPRPEIPALVKLYEKEIPYYNIRHLIKPGLSGWAQLYHSAPPKFSAGVDETKKKLSYDLYYIKNRSFILDLKVVLRTIKILLSREGV